MPRLMFLFYMTFSVLGIAEADELSRAVSPKCGLIVPLTGSASRWGVSVERSVQLAVRESGGRPFLVEDDAFLPKNTVSAFQKLVNRDHINCLIVFGSSTSLAIADMAEKHGIPTISLSLAPKVIENKRYVFRMHVPPERQIASLLSEISRRAYRAIGVVSTLHDASLALREGIVKEIPRAVVIDEQVQPGDTELQTLAAKIKQKNPSAVFLNLLPPQASALSKFLRAMDYQGEFFGGPLLANQDEVMAAMGSLDGAWLITADGSQGKEFLSRYEEQFHEPALPEALFGYDAATILLHAVRSGNSLEYLAHTKTFSGSLGQYGLSRQAFDIAPAIWTIRYNRISPLIR